MIHSTDEELQDAAGRTSSSEVIAQYTGIPQYAANVMKS